MRIAEIGTGCFPIPATRYGGIERFIGEMIPALEKRGHDVNLIHRTGTGSRFDEMRFAKWVVEDWKNQDDADIVHCHTPMVARALANAGIPYIYTSHSRHWFWKTSPTHYWGAYWEGKAVERSVGSIALSTRLMDLDTFDTFIPVCVDVDRWKPGKENHRTGALGVGAIIPPKRWEIAAEATRATQWKMAVLGPKTDGKVSRDLEADFPDADWCGEVSEEGLLRAYQRSAVYIHPSEVEVCCGSILQAMASGIPVISSWQAGEGLVVHGETGWTSPGGWTPGETTGYIHGQILGFQEEPERLGRMGEAGRKRAVEHFSPDAIAKRHVEFFESVLEGREAPRWT